MRREAPHSLVEGVSRRRPSLPTRKPRERPYGAMWGFHYPSILMQENPQAVAAPRTARLIAVVERLNDADRRAAQARSDTAARGEHLTDAAYRPLGDVAYDFSAILGFPISLHIAEKLFHSERTWKLPPRTPFTGGRKYERKLGFPISRDIEVRLFASEMSAR